MPVSFKPKVASKDKTTDDLPFEPDPPEETQVVNPIKKPKKRAKKVSPPPDDDDAVDEDESLVKVGKQGKSFTHVTHPDGSEEAESGNVGGFVVAQKPLCAVTVNMSATLNKGNFEFLRFGVTVSMPTEKENLDDTFSECAEYVDTKMGALNLKYVEADKKD